MRKNELRKKYLELRKALSIEECHQFSQEILDHFILHFKPNLGQKVHVFMPINKFREIDTTIFIKWFLKQGIRVFVPKIVDERLISIEIFEDSIFEVNNWGINEPISDEDSGILDFDFVITPLLYCDYKGNRVGYGKGFYDGFFEKISTNTKKIGVNYFNPDENIDDVREKDIRLDYLITPTEVLSFLDKSE